MSDIFEKDIEDEEVIENLEDSDFRESNEELVFENPLVVLKLTYSCESIYARNTKKFDLKADTEKIWQKLSDLQNAL